jgi:small-conductance mechanosensitive channel
MTDVSSKPESTTHRNLMLAATIVGVIVLMLSAFPLMMSPMIFDSGESATAWSIFIAIWMAPVVLIVGLVVGWIGVARRSQAMVVTGLLLAVAPMVAALGILLMAGV